MLVSALIDDGGPFVEFVVGTLVLRVNHSVDAQIQMDTPSGTPVNEQP